MCCKSSSSRTVSHWPSVGGFITALVDVDLTSIPIERLSSLVSFGIGPWFISIKNVSGCNLVDIIDSYNKILGCSFENQILGSEETKALVRVMDTRVEFLKLDSVTVDIEALLKYNGQGTCRTITYVGDTATREILRSWAQSRNWAVVEESEDLFRIKKTLK